MQLKHPVHGVGSDGSLQFTCIFEFHAANYASDGRDALRCRIRERTLTLGISIA